MEIEKVNLRIDTSKSFEIIDITSEIQDLCKIKKGIVNIFTKHSTSAIAVNENEKGLLKDFESALEKLIPKDNGYLHDNIDNNAHSHLKSFLLSSSQTVPIIDYKLDLGTWQSIFFIELDGPRNSRSADLTFIGEK